MASGMPSFEIGLSVSSIEKDYSHKDTKNTKTTLLCSLCLGGELLDFDFDVRAIDANVIPIRSTARRWAKHFAGGHVKNASVPGAGHLCASEFALTKRPAHMRARVVDGVKRTIDIEECNLFTVDLD